MWGDLEEGAGLEQGMEVPEAEVGGRAVAPEGVEVAAANEYQLRHAESGGAPGEGTHVMALRYVVHHHVALHHHRPGQVRQSHSRQQIEREREREMGELGKRFLASVSSAIY